MSALAAEDFSIGAQKVSLCSKLMVVKNSKRVVALVSDNWKFWVETVFTVIQSITV